MPTSAQMPQFRAIDTGLGIPTARGGKGIEPCIGGDIIRLPRCACGGGLVEEKQDQAVPHSPSGSNWSITRRPCTLGDSTASIWASDLPRQRAIVQHTGGMDHAGDRGRGGRCMSVNHPAHLRQVGDIRARRTRPARLWRRRVSSSSHHCLRMRRAVRSAVPFVLQCSHVPGLPTRAIHRGSAGSRWQSWLRQDFGSQRLANTAKAAGDQVGAAITEGRTSSVSVQRQRACSPCSNRFCAAMRRRSGWRGRP